MAWQIGNKTFASRIKIYSLQMISRVHGAFGIVKMNRTCLRKVALIEREKHIPREGKLDWIYWWILNDRKAVCVNFLYS